jgi:hypothetical protein
VADTELIRLPRTADNIADLEEDDVADGRPAEAPEED